MKLATILFLTATLAASPAAAQRRADPFAGMRADIDVFCGADRACRSVQRSNMGHFVTIMTGFRDPGHAVSRRCMEAGRVRRAGRTMIDWTVATACMQRAARGVELGGALRQRR